MSAAFGVSITVSPDLGDFAAETEDLHYDYIACGEHVMFHQPSLNSLVALSLAAGRTQTIKLLSAVALLPLYPAALIAKMATAIDYLSMGRFNLGVGVGGEFRREFDGCGIPLNERGRRADEALSIIGPLLEGRRVNHHGQFYDFEGLELSPKAVQRPRPPIWVAGRSHVAMRRAARYADWWLPYMYSPQQLADSIAAVHQLESEVARSASMIRCGVLVFATVYEDSRLSRRVAVRSMGETYRQDFSRLVGRYVIAGDPTECQARIAEYVEAGAEAIILRPACPTEDVRPMVSRIAREVIAPLRDRRTAQ